MTASPTAARHDRGRRVLGQAGVLLAAALLLTAVSWAVRPDRLPLRADTTVYELELSAPLVTVDEALLLYDEGLHIFVDTRPDGDVAAAPLAVPGAVTLRAASFDDDLLEVFDFVRPSDPLILYDDGGLVDANNIAVRLAGRGFTDVSIMAGGVGAWRDAGGETSAAPEPDRGAET